MNSVFRRALFKSDACGPARLHELVTSPDPAKIESLLNALFAGKRDIIRLSALNEGSEASANWVVWRVPSFDGESDSALIVSDGISEQDDLSEVLFQNQRWQAIGRLTGGVVHDFNNLLTGVMLYCDLLFSTLDARDLRRRYAEEIRSAILQASGLVRQLLVFARPQQLAAGPLSLNEIVEEMRGLLLRLIGENIALDLRLDPQLAVVEIARSQAQQVLLNLVLNARDALPGGGRICIETANCSFQALSAREPKAAIAGFPCVLLKVTDNGHGMDEETRARLFEPFFTTKKGKGSGLGLTTVHSVVSSHRGLIHLESESGRGTSALVLLPASFRSSHSSSSDFPKRNLQLISSAPLPDKQKEPLI